MYSSSFESVFDASAMAPQSPSDMKPARIFDRLTRASAHRIRWTSWPALISSEKKATAAPDLAAFTARFSANDVLPTPGRAARMTRSPPRKPWNRSSASLKPVGTPAMWFCCSASFVISSNASVSRESILENVDDTRFSVTPKSVFSASSTTSSRLSGAS